MEPGRGDKKIATRVTHANVVEIGKVPDQPSANDNPLPTYGQGRIESTVKSTPRSTAAVRCAANRYQSLEESKNGPELGESASTC